MVLNGVKCTFFGENFLNDWGEFGQSEVLLFGFGVPAVEFIIVAILLLTELVTHRNNLNILY
jgi:hypothetical protein